MILYLLRHTKTSCPAGMCYGQTDVALSFSYEDEKKQIIQNLKNITFSAIYSSPLQRCHELAKSIAKNKEIICDNRLMELNFGDWEGKMWKEIEQTQEAQNWFKDYVHTPCPNGESYVNLLQRVQEFLNNLQSKNSESPIFIVTHGGVIRAMHTIINSILATEAFNLKIEYGEIFKFEITSK